MKSGEMAGGITLALIAVTSIIASSAGVPALWSINLYYFMPPALWLITIVVAIIALGLVYYRSYRSAENQVFLRPISPMEMNFRNRILLALACGLVFYLLRMQIFLYGDGYHAISNFGQVARPVYRWTEPAMGPLVRAVQSLFGAPTEDTALYAFQTLSAFSGTVVILNFIGLARCLTRDLVMRWVIFFTLTLSGSIVLFLGYVEYYPIVWAVATSFVHFALRFAVDRSRRDLLLATLAFVIGASLHLEILYFAPGIAYLWYLQLSSFGTSRGRRILSIGFVSLSLAIGLAIIWRVWSDPVLQRIFLPLVQGRLRSPDYAILSPRHLLDTFNLSLLMYPTWLALTAFILFGTKQKATSDNHLQDASRFLAFAAVGPLVFLLIVDPLFGMAIDWDLMSLTLFVPCVWLLCKTAGTIGSVSIRFAASLAVVSAVIVVGFVACMYSEPAAIGRFRSVLDYYQTKNRGGWYVLYKFAESRGNEAGKQIASEGISRWFPEEALLPKTYAALDRSSFAEARDLALQMVKIDSERADYLQAAAKAYKGLGHMDSAVTMYRRALFSRPHDPHLRNEFGQLLTTVGDFDGALKEFRRALKDDPSFAAVREGIALVYIRSGRLSSAQLVADSLFIADPTSAGGHLIAMIVALNSSDTISAKQHYSAYVQYGSHRSDYDRIRKYYDFLIYWTH